MPELNEEEVQARSLGLALLDASRIYEGFVIIAAPNRSAARLRRPWSRPRHQLPGVLA